MAKKPRRRSAAREARKRGLAIAGIVVFLLVDILLVALALQSTAPTSTGSASADVPSPNASTPVATPTATPTPTDTVVMAVPPTRIVAALDADVAWRATTGSCPDAAATPELTVDGGSTWTSSDLTGATGVSALQRIVVSGSTTATFLGFGADCAPDAARTFVSGADFADDPAQLADSWYLTPVGSSSLHSPIGDVAAPCTSAVTISPLDDERAGVLCADSSLHVTVDAGGSWTALAPLPGAVAVSEMADGFLVGAVGASDCAGVQLSEVSLDDTRTDVGCVESTTPAAELAGSTAFDWTDDGIWMWVDERLLISTDEGATWE